MESIKGIARRAKQSAKEKFASADGTRDDRCLEVSKKVQLYARASTKISDKVTRLGRLFEEIGQVLQDIGTDYKSIGALPGSEMDKLSDEVTAVGQEVAEKSKEFHKVLKENAFDPITNFLKDLPKLKPLEDEQKRVQLEFDFFRNKVHDLKRNHQKDPTRIPRNEQILEKWRQDVHFATEKTKGCLSELHAQGLRVLDLSLFTVSQCTGNYSTYTNTLCNQHFLGARLPIYPSAPLLPPEALPPSPFQTTPMPGPQVPGGGGPQPSNLNYGYDQQQQQQQQGNASGAWTQQPPPGQYQQQQSPSGQWQQPPQQQQGQWQQQSPPGQQQSPRDEQQQQQWGQQQQQSPQGQSQWSQSPQGQGQGQQPQQQQQWNQPQQQQQQWTQQQQSPPGQQQPQPQQLQQQQQQWQQQAPQGQPEQQQPPQQQQQAPQGGAPPLGAQFADSQPPPAITGSAPQQASQGGAPPLGAQFADSQPPPAVTGGVSGGEHQE